MSAKHGQFLMSNFYLSFLQEKFELVWFNSLLGTVSENSKWVSLSLPQNWSMTLIKPLWYLKQLQIQQKQKKRSYNPEKQLMLRQVILRYMTIWKRALTKMTLTRPSGCGKIRNLYWVWILMRWLITKKSLSNMMLKRTASPKNTKPGTSSSRISNNLEI